MSPEATLEEPNLESGERKGSELDTHMVKDNRKRMAVDVVLETEMAKAAKHPRKLP